MDADAVANGVELGAIVIDIPHGHLHHGGCVQGICKWVRSQGEQRATSLGKGKLRSLYESKHHSL